MADFSAIIVAAGKGERLKEKVPKVYIKLGGKCILLYSVEVFEELEEIKEIIIVTLKEWLPYCKNLVKPFINRKRIAIIEGGEERQDSVRRGLERALGDFVLIHDGARPFITKEFVLQLMGETQKYDAIIPCLPVKETIKIVKNNYVKSTPPRETLYLTQTPQVFKRELLISAYNKAYEEGFYGKDEATLVERIGKKVKVVEGLEVNLKITTKIDLWVGEVILNFIKKLNK